MINIRRLKLITIILIAALAISPWALKHPKFQNPQNDPGNNQNTVSSLQDQQTEELTIFQGQPLIVDGDTVFIEGQKLRFWGIDAPDRDGPASVYYSRSTEYLKRYSGEIWTCQHTGGFSFDRPIVRCKTDLTSLDPALEVVRAGLAVDWPLFSNRYYAEYERYTRQNRLGVWQSLETSWR